MLKYKIGFIGAGVMAKAIIGQLLSKKVFEAGEILVSDIDDKKLDKIKRQLKVKVAKSNQSLVSQSEVIFLAVKPQSFSKISEGLKNVIFTERLVLSIMAGVNINKIKSKLNADKVIRIMPNMPAQVSCGMSVWTTIDKVSRKDKNLVAKILRALGVEIYVGDENLINSATAISGSGPAYLFLVMEAICKEAVNLGFSENQAKKLVIQTVLGSAQIAKLSLEDFQSLRKKVTSKGGTTEAALKILNKGRFIKTFSQAIQAAYNRAKELSE